MFVQENVAGVETPATVALIVKAPAVPLAMNDVVVARPFESVEIVLVSCPPNLALAPDAGAVKVTVAPGTGLPPESLTSATSGFA